MLAVVDEEVGLGSLRQRVLARVRVRRPLRHPPPLSSAARIRRQGKWPAFKRAGGYPGGGSPVRAATPTPAPGRGILASPRLASGGRKKWRRREKGEESAAAAAAAEVDCLDDEGGVRSIRADPLLTWCGIS